MPMRIEYEYGLQGELTDITNRVRLYTFDATEKAEEGSVAISSIVIDDPDGDFDIVGWRTINVYEDSATGSNTLTHRGWIAERRVTRGPSMLTGDARIWDVSLADMNALIHMRVLNEPNADRPAETDVQRIQWLMAQDEMNRITGTAFISTASPKNMDEVDYRGQTLYDVINDCAQQSGKNFWVGTDQGAAVRFLWYDFASSSAYSSPLRLSNVLADIDSVWTFAIAEDTTLTRDPSRVYSGAYVRFDGGSVYEEDFSISNQFTRRDAVYDASNVKHAATATRRALRYLSQSSEEEDRITTAVFLPAPKVNMLKPGMRVQFRASHLPGYESFTWARVLERKVKEVSEVDDTIGPKYFVSLELSTSGTAVAGGTCSTNGGQLVIHTTTEATAPDARYAIHTGPDFQHMTLRVTDLGGGNYSYTVPAGQCCIWLVGTGGFGGVPFDGVTWTPTGGDATYYPENGDGLGGHFFQYGIAIPNSFTAAASTWSFPVYQYTGAGGVGGKTDYGIGLNNGIAFVLP